MSKNFGSDIIPKKRLTQSNTTSPQSLE